MAEAAEKGTADAIDEDSQTDSEDDDESAASESSSSDENDEKEKCPICLNKLRNQELGTPETCDHTFCFDCISEWSTNTNTCPIDRKKFSYILVKHEVNGSVIRRASVKQKKYDSDGIEADDDERTFCEVCGQANFEERLLLCDGCDKGYHLECLTPPLDEIPIDQWFCPDCVVRQERNRRPAAVRRRAIPRTRATERVRNRIANRLDFVVDSSSDDNFSVDDNEDAESDDGADDDAEILYELLSDADNAPSTSTSVKPKPPVRRRRRRRRRRRTVKRSSGGATSKSRSKLSKTSKKVSCVRKRRRRRRRRRTVKRIAKPTTLRRTLSDSDLFAFLNLPHDSKPQSQQGSVKSRLADQLGIIPPKKAFQQPSVKLKAPPGGEGVSSSAIGSSRSFSLFGNHNEILHFNEEDDETHNDSCLSENARRFNRRLIGRISSKQCNPHHLKNQISESSISVSKDSVKKVEESDDLLGSIFENQSLLLQKSQHVVVNRDGTLEARKFTSDNVADKPPNDSTKCSAISEVSSKPSDSLQSSTSNCNLSAETKSNSDAKTELSVSICEKVVDANCRKSLLDTRIEALAASNTVSPQNLPETVAIELCIKESSQKRKGLLPSPAVAAKKPNVAAADLAPPPPPPPSSFESRTAALARAYHQHSVAHSRPPVITKSGPSADTLLSDRNAVSTANRLNFATGSSSMLPNVHVPPPSTPISMSNYATSAFLPAIARGAPPMLPVRLPFPFGAPDLNAAQLNDALNASALHQLAGLRFALSPTTIRIPTVHGGSAFVQLPPSYHQQQQLSFPFLAQQTHHQSLTPTTSFQSRPPSGLLLNQLAAMHDFPQMQFGAFHHHQQNASVESLQQHSYVSDPQLSGAAFDIRTITGSNLIMHDTNSKSFEASDPVVPEIKSPSSIPLPPDEPVARTAATKFDLKDADIPGELLGLLTQFAQMKNEQSLRDTVKKSPVPKSVAMNFSSSSSPPCFEPSPVKRPSESVVSTSTISSAKKAPPVVAEDDDSPALSFYDGDFSPDVDQQLCVAASTAAPNKPVRSVQFHPEVEDKTAERLSKSEKMQKKTEEKLKNLLSRVSASGGNGNNNNGASGCNADEEVPSSAVDLRRRERLLAKFNYQLRVEEEVKIALKPFYSKRRITKEQYKNIMRKTVPKICKKKAEINPAKIHAFVESYIQKAMSSMTASSKIKNGKQRKSEDD